MNNGDVMDPLQCEDEANMTFLSCSAADCLSYQMQGLPAVAAALAIRSLHCVRRQYVGEPFSVVAGIADANKDTGRQNCPEQNLGIADSG